MSTYERWHSEKSVRRPIRWALALFVALTFHGGTSAPAVAQAQGSNRPTATSSDQSLRQALESRYEVLALRDGVLLRPRTERSGVRSIEVSGTAIAVNGERVSEGVLRAWLGSDAPPLLRLLAMSGPSRRAVFGFSSPEGGASSRGTVATATAPVDPEEGGAQEMVGGSSSAEELTSDLVEEPEAPAPPPPPAPPEPPDRDSDSGNKVRIGTLIRFAGSARVDVDEEAEQVVVIGGPASIEGSVQDEVTAIGGDVRVNGHVGGDVISVGGDVHLGPKAEVEGDVTSVGGQVDHEPGSNIHGQINQVSGFGPGIHIGRNRDFHFWPWWTPFAGAMRLVWSILALAILALVVAVTVVIARDPVARVEAKLATELWQSGLAGFLAQLLFIPLFVAVTVVLVISIIGIPLLILYPFLILALILGGLVGFSAFALRVGRLIERRFDRHFGSVVATALVGVFAIEILRIVGRLFDVGSGPFGVISWFFSFTGFLIAYAAWTFGFGAVILTRFGLGPRRPRGEPFVGATYPPAPVEPIEPIPPVEPIEPAGPGGEEDSAAVPDEPEADESGERPEKPAD